MEKISVIFKMGAGEIEMERKLNHVYCFGEYAGEVSELIKKLDSTWSHQDLEVFYDICLQTEFEDELVDFLRKDESHWDILEFHEI